MKIKRTYAPFRNTMVAPNVEPFAAPLSFICFSTPWRPYVLGALAALAQREIWEGSTAQIDLATQRASEIFEAGVANGACPVIQDIRLVGCVLQVNIDGTWTTVGDLSACGAQGPQGIQGIQGIQGVAGSAALANEVLIQSITLGSQATSITFSSIPGGYQALRIRCLLRSTYAGTLDAVSLRFNGDAAANYKGEFIAGSGGVVSGVTGATTSISIAYVPGATAPGGSFAMPIIEIPFYYAVGVTHHAHCLSEYGAVNVMGVFGGEWTGTAQITSIAIIPANSPNLIAGCQAHLWGVRF